MDDESERIMTQAWLTASLSRAKKVPSLKTLLNKSKAGTQSTDQMLAAIRTLSDQYGLPIRRVDH
jgi:hypothetical protein